MTILSDLQRQAFFESPFTMATRTLRAYSENSMFAPSPMAEICSKLGIIVLKEDLSRNFAKLVYHKYPPTIYLNKATERQSSLNFSMAHMLGHIIYHKDKIDEISESQGVQMTYKSQDPKELMCQEAQKFAINILVPLWKLDLYVRVKGITSAELAKRFNVHINVINYQLNYLL